ncbi:MAG: hypothetical protein AAF413_02640 [Patescibacteria group bacterium]
MSLTAETYRVSSSGDTPVLALNPAPYGVEVSWSDVSVYTQAYRGAADALYYGNCSGYGSLSGHSGGALRAEYDKGAGPSYILTRPDQPKRGDKDRSVSDWNLDYTTDVQIAECDPEAGSSIITVEDFVAGLVLSLPSFMTQGHGINNHHISALSAAIRIKYEKGWLDYTGRSVKSSADRYPLQHARDVDDDKFKNAAADLILRGSHIEAMEREFVKHLREAHDIALGRGAFGTAREAMFDRAWTAITRPDREVGMYAIGASGGKAMLDRLWSTPAPPRHEIIGVLPKGVLHGRRYENGSEVVDPYTKGELL